MSNQNVLNTNNFNSYFCEDFINSDNNIDILMGRYIIRAKKYEFDCFSNDDY